MKLIVSFLSASLFVAVLGSVYIWTGMYAIGADSPHWRLTSNIMNILRQRAVMRHAKNIPVPDLDNPEWILKGAGQYAAMCVQCHLAPTRKTSELRMGLSPLPPDLTKVRVDPGTAFWIIKHGIKMSAMPAWGISHDDATIWCMVAFLQKLPKLTPAQYAAIVAKAPPDDDMRQ